MSAGWPSKTMPNMSKVSRSCQSLVGYVATIDGMCGSLSGQLTSSRIRRLKVIESRW